MQDSNDILPQLSLKEVATEARLDVMMALLACNEQLSW